MSDIRQRNLSKKIIINDDDDYDNQNKQQELSRSNFTLTDVIRILLGIVFLNLVLSYYVTRTPLWGVQTKLTNPRYLQFVVKTHVYPRDGYLNLTESELSKFNGEDPNLPIYVALNGSVYDVSSNPGSYGPMGSYSFFSGRDAARAYVTGCFRQDLTHDLRGLDLQKAENDIAGWKRFYQNSHRYWFVGYVHHEPLTGEPPAPCNGAQKP